jgi:hypothetical protein
LWSEHLRVRHNKGKAFQKLPHLDAFVSKRPPQDPSFVLQLMNFVNAIRGTENLVVNGYEGMANVNVVRGAYGDGSASDAAQDAAAVPAISSAATQNRGER